MLNNVLLIIKCLVFFQFILMSCSLLLALVFSSIICTHCLLLAITILLCKYRFLLKILFLCELLFSDFNTGFRLDLLYVLQDLFFSIPLERCMAYIVEILFIINKTQIKINVNITTSFIKMLTF